MENLEICARTVEEATKKALTQLNAGLDEVEITVLSGGKSGILGLGAEDARISVRLVRKGNSEDTEAIEEAENILKSLLDRMGIQAAIDIEYPQVAVNEEGEANPVVFNITGDDLGVLIGRRGQTLDALQYLMRLIISRQAKSKIPITIDVENYRQKRYEDLRTLALNVADQVKAKRTSCRLEPMPAFERRIIHLTLANDPEVTTESIGEGEARKVVVMPKSNRSKG
jgi:spoIIIJ-associated protein